MKDFYLGKWTIRIWYRYKGGIKRKYSIVYGFHDYGAYCFGAGPVGFMVWPPR